MLILEYLYQLLSKEEKMSDNVKEKTEEKTEEKVNMGVNQVDIDKFYTAVGKKLDMSVEEIERITAGFQETIIDFIGEAISGEHITTVIENPFILMMFSKMNTNLYYDVDKNDIYKIDKSRYKEQFIPHQFIHDTIHKHSGIESAILATNEELHEFFKESTENIKTESDEQDKYLKEFKNRLVNVLKLDDVYRANAIEHLRIAYQQGQF